jgi:hypothetical protein
MDAALLLTIRLLTAPAAQSRSGEADSLYRESLAMFEAGRAP